MSLRPPAAVLMALFWAMPAPPLSAAPAALQQSLEAARRSFASSRTLAREAEAEAAPLAEKVRAAKANADPSWWTRWRLRKNLGSLQQSLDRLREARASYEAARQELFLVLSALQEELRSSLKKELSRRSPDKARMAALFSRKQDFDQELESLGYGEGKPYPLQDAPAHAAVPLLQADRQKALQARSIQLEAWLETVKEDLALLRQARSAHALEEAAARARQAQLEDLIRRIAALMESNEKQLLSKN